MNFHVWLTICTILQGAGKVSTQDGLGEFKKLAYILNNVKNQKLLNQEEITSGMPFGDYF